MASTTPVHEQLMVLDALMDAARVFAGITAESIAQTGDSVTLPQLRVLVLASTRSALSNAEVADALDVHLSNASRTCDRLVRAGLLSRRASPHDRRRVELNLTADGEELLDTVTAHRRAAFSRILRQMPPEEQLVLAPSLRAFSNHADEISERRFAAIRSGADGLSSGPDRTSREPQCSRPAPTAATTGGRSRGSRKESRR